MIILGRGNCLDLEELAVQESPRSTRIWEKIDFLSDQVYNDDGRPKCHGNGVPVRTTKMMFGIPVGFIMTGALCTMQSAFWIALLITVSGLKSHSWFILAVGALGMFQNAAVAAISRDPAKRNLPLIAVDQIICRTVMDGLMDLEITFPGQAPFLIEEFFPGELREDEVKWWKGEREPYDKKRFSESKRRGIPRSMLPKYQNSNNSPIWRGDEHPDESDGPELVEITTPLVDTRPTVETTVPTHTVRSAQPTTTSQRAPLTINHPPESSKASAAEPTPMPPSPAHTESPVSPRHTTPTSTTTSTIPFPDLPPTTSPASKPPSPKKAKGPVTFADNTKPDADAEGETESHDFAPKQPTRAMTQPEKPSPKTEHRPSASLSVDEAEIYKITHDWT